MKRVFSNIIYFMGHNERNIYLLIGFGISNRAVFKFLKRKRKKVMVYDDKLIQKGIINHLSHIDFSQVKIIIISAGISPDHSINHRAMTMAIPIKIDLDILYEYRRNRDIFIGITGTNGKTTTVNMISHLLPVPHLVCGNIGVSIFRRCPIYKKYRIYIIEVSSFQLHYMNHMIFHTGLISNFASNHDEWHKGIENYRAAKMKILSRSLYPYNPTGNWYIKDHNIFFQDKSMIHITNSYLQLSHNEENLITALNVVMFLLELIKSFEKPKLSYINSFISSRYRQQIIHKNHHICIVNDSKSTNIHSSNAAIKNFFIKDKRLYVMMGGYIKGDLNTLTYHLVDHFILFGKGASLVGEFLNKNSYVNYTIYSNLATAIHHMPQLGTILFSPGGASFDEFRDYLHRGEFFTNKVKELFYQK